MNYKMRVYKFLPMLAGIAVVSGVAVGLGIYISDLLAVPPNKKKMIQQISLIKPPPPPPEVQPPPEPEIEEVKIDEPDVPEDIPDTALDEPPPGDLLGLDADGTGASDDFNLIGNKGGRTLLGDHENPFVWYTNRLGSHIESLLYNFAESQNYSDIRKGHYEAKIKIWVNTDRSLTGSLLNSTGDKNRDKIIRQVLANLGEYTVAAPVNMLQPIRITLRSTL